MYCNACGSLIKDGLAYCPFCGEAVVVEPAPQPVVQPVQQVQPAPQPVAQPVQQVQPVYIQPVPPMPGAVPEKPVRKSKGLAIAGFALGISAAVFCFLIFVNFVSLFEGLAGAILSILALVKKNGKLKAMAVIGLILSVFALFVAGLMWASFWSEDAYDLSVLLFGWVYDLPSLI